ncbi:MAG: protein kinase [Verrucomicrobiia bacterium]
MDKAGEQGCPQCGAVLSPQAIAGLCPICLGRLVLSPAAAGASTGGSRPEVCSPGGGGVPRFGEYELLEEIASGGMGVVYRARQLSLNRIVALKMVLPPRLNDARFLHRFRTEAEATAQLQHPSIVAIHSVGEIDGQPYYTMDFVEGRTLAQLVEKSPLEPVRAAAYVKAIAEAIHYAHQRGILHRDLKPSNVLIDTDDKPRVTDFGLAKLLHAEADLTLSGHLLGSPSYMAPEQAEGRWRDVSVRSDVYSLGAMLYELVTGRPPFHTDSALATLKQVLETAPLPPSERNSAVPLDLDTICLKCLEKNPGQRFHSAQELADELGRFLRNEPIEARPVNALERCARWCHRNPRLAAALGGVGLSLLLGVMGIAWEWRKADAQRRRAEQEQRITRRHLYAADMYAAQQAFDAGNWGLVRQLLGRHIPKAGQEDLRGFEWRHLRSQVQGEQRYMLPGHSNLVSALAFSPDGRMLLSAGREDCLRLWDTREMSLRAILPCITGHVYRMAFSPGGTELAIGAWRGFEIWDTKLWNVKAQAAGLNCWVAYAPSGSALGVGQGNSFWGMLQTGPASLCNPTNGAPILGLTNAGGRLAFSPDGRVLATGNWNDKIKLWELPGGELRHTIPVAGMVMALEFSGDGRMLGAARWDDDPMIWSASDGAPLGTLAGGTRRSHTLAFSPDSRMLATAGSDQTVDLWDTEKRQLLTRLRGHGGEIWSLAFSPDGRLLASGGRDDAVFIWDPASRPPPNTLTGLVEHLGMPVFAISRTGSRLAALTPTGLGVWNARSLDRHGPLLDATSPLAFFSDEDHLLTVRLPSSLVTWDLATAQPVKEVQLPVSVDFESDCRLSPSGQWIACASLGPSLCLIETQTGRLLSEPKPHSRYVLALGFTPDEKFLVSSDRTGNAFLWELPSLEPRGIYQGHRDYIRGLGISPDGMLLATASADCTVRVWSVRDCRELAVLRDHSEDAIDAVFSPDGLTLASTSYDHTVRLWHVSTFREMAAYHHQARALRALFSADGRLLAAMGAGGSIRLWRAD